MPLLVLWTLASCAGPKPSELSQEHTAPRAIRFSPSVGPLRIALAGLVHQHCERLLVDARERDDIEIVGIAEPNEALFERLAAQHGLDPRLRFESLEALLDSADPEVVSAMTTIADHVGVVEACAPRGIHVLVEKPLAFRRPDAERMGELAAQHGVLVLTNFETSWSASVREARRLVESGDYGPIRRMVFRHGHPGPVEIGCYAEFTDWLKSPEAGGGAMVDFGCYGAVLATWMMDGAVPARVIASAQTLRPEVYPNVEDDGTIILEYPKASAVVEASWNWTHNVKEMDLYTESGSLHAGLGDALTVRRPDGAAKLEIAPPLPPHLRDQWSYLKEVIRGQCQVDQLSSLKFNTVVTGILDDARRQVAQRNQKKDAKKFKLPPSPRVPRRLNLGGRRR